MDQKFSSERLFGYGNYNFDYTWCTKHLNGINWSRSYEKYTELEKVLKNKSTRNEVFAKVYEKSTKLSEI